jgi:outer membrane protein TolC
MIQRIVLILFIFTYFLQAYSQTLDFYLEKGLQNSPLLKDYQNQISSATFDSLIVIATQKPQINANGTIYYAPVFNNNINGYDQVITNGGAYSTTIGVQQYIFNKKTLANKYSSIQLQKQSLTNVSKLSANELKRAITNQYIIIFSDNSDISFNQKFLKLMQDENEIMKTLVKQGIYRQTDYLSLLIETQSQEILVNQLMAQMTKDVHLINQLSGINDTGQNKFNLPVLIKKDQADLAFSPLFKQYTIDSLKIINEKYAVDVRYRPKINWTVDAGFLSSALSAFYQHYGFSAGLNISIPIYDGRQRMLDYQKLAIEENTRENYKSFFTNQYHQQVNQINNDLSANKTVIMQLSLQLKSSEDLISLAKAQLNNGNMPITEFINAAKNYITINKSLSQSKLKELQLINELNYLMQ